MRLAVYGTLCAIALASGIWYYAEMTRLDAPSRLPLEKQLAFKVPLGVQVDLPGLQTIHGTPIDTSLFRQKLVILEFWATWCHPCVEGMREVEKTFQALAGEDIKFLAINTGQRDSLDHAYAFAKARNWSLPVAFDGSGKLSQAITDGAIPTTGIVGKDGRLCARVDGIPAKHGSYEAKIQKLIRQCRAAFG